MILYIENPKNCTKKKKTLLELISKFSKVAAYKINIQKSTAFLYISWFANRTPYTERKKRQKKEAGHSRLVDGRFNQQGNLHTRLVLDGHKMSRSLHPLTRILNVYLKAVTGFSLIYHPDSLNNITSGLCP